MAPKSFPKEPIFIDSSERVVWEELMKGLPDNAYVVYGLKILEHEQEYELDFIVLWPDVGVSVLEVKGGDVTPNEDSTFTQRDSQTKRIIDPVTQLSKNHYALRRFLERKTSLPHISLRHFLVFPYSDIKSDFSRPNIPRKIVIDSIDLINIVPSIKQEMLNNSFRPSFLEVNSILKLLGQNLSDNPKLSQMGAIREREVTSLTEQQYKVLDLCKLMNRFAVLGAAGCGKTFVAIEQAKRRSNLGDSVLFLCYNRGLAEYLRRQLDSHDSSKGAIRVATLHSLPSSLGMKIDPTDDDHYWDCDLPEMIAKQLFELDDEFKYDTVIIDEAQDFHPQWWEVVINLLKNRDSGSIFAFGDMRQGIFRRADNIPLEVATLCLDTNLRNSLPIARLASICVTDDLVLAGLDGPSVRFLETSADSAIQVAESVLGDLQREGWSAGDICLLTTGSRHPQQVRQVSQSTRYEYWNSFFESDEVFYSHVLGFKGLERRVIVLAVNGWKHENAKKDMLYTAVTRARDLLVICSSVDDIRQAGGKEFLKALVRHPSP